MIIETSKGDKSVASGGVGGTALGLSIGALSLAALQGNSGNGILGNIFGNGCQNQTNALMAELAKEKSERYTDQVGTEVYKQFAKERNETQAQISALFAAIAQMDKNFAVKDAVNGERITCLGKKVDDMYDVFKLVIPNGSVCPGWGDITITPATTTTPAG